MGEDPLLRMLADLVVDADGHMEQQLADTCVELLGVSGASAAFMVDGSHWAALFASGPAAARLVDLQNTLGEGPSVDAQRYGVPVGEVDLAHPDRPRWIAFSGPAHAAGAGALFAFPMRTGAVSVGVLTLHQRRAGPLSDDQFDDALAWADALTELVLGLQAEAPPQALATALEAMATHQAEVHQAAGILVVRLGIVINEALVRLRAHAYAEGRPLVEVARGVVAGHLRME